MLAKRVMMCSLDGVSSASADRSGQAESYDNPASVVVRCVSTDCPRRGSEQSRKFTYFGLPPTLVLGQ